MKALLRFIFLLLNLLTVGVLLLAGVGQLLSPAVFPLPNVIGIAYEWLLIVNVFFVVFWLLTAHKSWAVLSVIALLCSVGAIRRTIRFSEGEQAVTGKEITILSYNTHCLGFDNTKAKDNPILQYIKQQDADVVCLQEFVAYKNNLFFTLLAIKQYLDYPYSYIDFKQYKGKRRYGLAIFSKYPLINKQTLRYESSTNISNRCDIVLGNDTLRLFTNHLQSNRLEKDDVQPENMQQTADNVSSKLFSAAKYRAAQARFLRDEIRQSPYPVVVCGDFNDVPVSYTYRTISKGLNDAFLVNNAWQLGHTFDKSGLGVRIDYILYDKQLSSYDFSVDKTNKLSDHYPITCTLVLPQ